MIKNSKGFTLIELLAVIVILATIALIAVPNILDIINSSKLSAAEDSTMGIVKAAKNYIGNFIVKNDGSFSSGGLTFSCNVECVLDRNSAINAYNLDSLLNLKFNGREPSSGKVEISGDGETIIVTNLTIGNYICNYPGYGNASCVVK